MNQSHRNLGSAAKHDPPPYRIASDFEPDIPPDPRGGPTVIVVKEQPSRGLALLLPPLFIVMIGAGFLAYRARANDWRGLAALFETAPTRNLVAKVDNPPTPSRPPLSVPDPKPDAPVPQTEPEIPQTQPEPPTQAEPPPTAKADDPFKTDIEAEAEKTREKIAELERLKEREAEELAATEADRRAADRPAPKLPRFQFRGIPPEEIEKLLQNQREQMAFAEKLMERQLREMAEMQRRFLREGVDTPDPRWPPRFAIPMPRAEAPLLPRAGRPGAGNNGDRIIRTPDGGIARFRQFQGPNGAQRFEWRWESAQPPGARPRFVPNEPNEDDVPPPPRPAPARRRID
jgi:hypothetical protein